MEAKHTPERALELAQERSERARIALKAAQVELTLALNAERDADAAAIRAALGAAIAKGADQ